MDRIGLPLPWDIVPAQRLRRVVLVSSPAAGAEFSVAVPGGVLWRVASIKARLTTAVAAANRQPNLEVTDGTTFLFGVGAVSNQVASSVVDHSWIQGYATNAADFTPGEWSNFFPEFPLLDGYVIRTNTGNIQAADQWSQVVALVDEYQVRGLERAVERYEREVAEAIAAPG